MSAVGRCQAAHREDPSACEGDRAAVRVVDRLGVHVSGCVHHAARLYASVDGARLSSEPGHEGAAIDAYCRAERLRPWPWLPEGGHVRGAP